MKGSLLYPCRLTGVLLLGTTFILNAVSGPLKLADVNDISSSSHLAGLTAKITLLNGSTRIIRLDGIGCSVSICSRVFITGKDQHNSVTRIWFDTLSAIKDITENRAVFILSDGTAHQLSLLPDFRVIYLASQNGRPERIDFSKIKSLDVLPPTR
jgi:hypothetical protein